jgi:DNA-binding transcriptional ArsR family regulator
VAAALSAPDADSNPSARDALRKLKADVLGAAPPPARAGEVELLMPAEVVVHADEWADVQQQRQSLSIPAAPETHARAHLAIAQAYAAIAAKEREAALALIEQHGLRTQFITELDDLRQTFERELTREQQLAAAWRQAATDVVDDSRRAALIAYLLREGAVNKSGYGELCGVAPATASKHLAMLTERGLLVQLGKGPATRYELPPPA